MGCPGQAGGLNKILGHDTAGDPVDQPTMPGPPQSGDGNHGVAEIGAQDRSDRERHHQRRHRQHDVGQPHDDKFGAAAEIPGRHAEQHPERHGNAEHAGDQSERDAVAENHPGEDVAPGIVGAHPVERIGWGVAMAKIHHCASMSWERGNPGGKNRRQNHRHHHQPANHGNRVTQQTPPRALSVADHARPRRRRGSRTPISMSINRLATTKNSPDTSTTPITALKSLLRMARTP